MSMTANTAQPANRDRLLRLTDVELLTTLRKTTIYLLMGRGEFPRCVPVGPRRVAWYESECLRWVQDRRPQAGACAAGPNPDTSATPPLLTR